MSLSLVGDYTDSSDEGEEENKERTQERQEDELLSKSKGDSSMNRNRGRLLLDPFGVGGGVDDDNNGPSSSDSQGTSDEEDNDGGNAKPGDGITLDNPFRCFGSVNNVADSKDSVMRVEFKESQKKAEAILERHVKMSQISSSSSTAANGKKVCWNYRRGKCRFGHNCIFAHDTDTDVIDPESGKKDDKSQKKEFNPVQPTTTNSTTTSSVLHSKNKNPFCMDKVDWSKDKPVVLSSYPQLGGGQKKGESQGSDDEDDISGIKKVNRKRPGLSSTLVPGKKVMNMYYKDKDKKPL